MKKLTLFLSMVFASSLVLSAQPALSKSYRWVDDNGNIRVTDYPPPSSSSAGRSDPTPQVPVARQQVELYITSWCPYCRKAELIMHSTAVEWLFARQSNLCRAQCRPASFPNGTLINI